MTGTKKNASFGKNGSAEQVVLQIRIVLDRKKRLQESLKYKP